MVIETRGETSELNDYIYDNAQKLSDFDKVHEETATLGGSEDFTYFMKNVQENGGLATFIILGTELKGGHHKANFDIDESSLIKGVKLLTNLVTDLT